MSSGGPQSDWIKKNAKSGAARNEEYYGKVFMMMMMLAMMLMTDEDNGAAREGVVNDNCQLPLILSD